MKKSIPLKEIAALTGSTLFGDPEELIFSPADLSNAKKGEISFLANLKYKQAFFGTQASAVFIPLSFAEDAKNFPHIALLIHEQPSLAFQQVIDFFLSMEDTQSGFKGIHPTAVLHPSVQIGNNVHIAPYAVVDKEVILKDNVSIGSFCYVGPFSELGENTLLHPHVVLREKTILGKNVIIQPGAVLGSCGFGYIQTKEGKHQKLNQLGNVVLENDVEIGANTTIDRGRFQPTKISTGSKIDNLVQIGHAVDIGPYNIIVAQSGFAGSSKTGKYCLFGGQSAVGGHLILGDQIQVAAKSGVTKSLKEKGMYGGFPAYELKTSNKDQVLLRRITSLFERLKEVEVTLQKITAL